MAKNLDSPPTIPVPGLAAAGAAAGALAPSQPPGAAARDQGQRLRQHLQEFLARLAAPDLTVQVPELPPEELPRAEGHFHLVPELFLQVGGTTRFRFPNAVSDLAPGQVLLVPPRLLHAEEVSPGSDGTPFCNIVINATGPSVSCHLAHEARPGHPGIQHLEIRRHPQAASVLGWLADAARLGLGDAARTAPPATPAPLAHAASPAGLAQAQVRALVAASAAGVLRALAAPGGADRPEPALVAQARILVQNQLGDHELGVRRLASQLGCTPDYLSHLFGQTTGAHLAAHINRQRMERAAHLLRETRLSGKQIAWACGFASQTYFIRSFRLHFGVTPKAWRSTHPNPDPQAATRN